MPLSPVKSYKNAFDFNGGPLTVGMGAYAPVNFIDYKLEEKIAQKIIFPLLDGLNNDGITFTGVLSTEIILNERNEPFVTEFNARFNDPDVRTILPLLETDLFDIFYSVATGAFSDDYEFFEFNDYNALSVVLAAGGYPGNFKRGYLIEGLELIDDDNVLIFHSGTSINKYLELTTGEGRVLTLTSIASTLNRATEKAYESIDLINFKDMRYRKDIAKSTVDEKVLFKTFFK